MFGFCFRRITVALGKTEAVFGVRIDVHHVVDADVLKMGLQVLVHFHCHIGIIFCNTEIELAGKADRLAMCRVRSVAMWTATIHRNHGVNALRKPRYHNKRGATFRAVSRDTDFTLCHPFVLVRTHDHCGGVGPAAYICIADVKGVRECLDQFLFRVKHTV